mmetsp:Transcript_76038/g.236092  ORF Transcript_76038/g.236092 Transcript_76038/m.236092 type:complete len:407 (-) Transcript_76038:53-1273(-)
MPFDLARADPRMRRALERRAAEARALVKEALRRDPQAGETVRKLLQPPVASGGGGGQAAPPSREEMVQGMAARKRALQAAMEQAGVWDEWQRLQSAPYDEAMASLGQGLEVTEHTTLGVDGNSIPLCTIRPAGAGPVPCVYYIHGGGMVSLSSRDGKFQMFGRLVARQGVAVCLVEFRNAAEATKAVPEVAPYPAGLNDCYDGLVWLNSNKAALGLSDEICVAGESGGANLSLAVALRAKRQGQLHLLSAGVFALCPYIAGHWPLGVQHEGILGASHVENGPMPGSAGLTVATMYGIEAFRAKDPLAWVGFATEEDLRGLPRMVISVNEGDVYRDEGVNLYRRCLRAGVAAQCRMVMGTLHANDMEWDVIPDVALSTARAMADFAANGRMLQRLSMPPSLPPPSKL